MLPCRKPILKNSRDMVLFLGAGFSRDMGLPTIAEFGAESADQLSRLKRPHNKRESTPYLIKAGDIFAKFQGYCQTAKRSINLDVNNMEQIFCIAEAFGEAKTGELDLDGKRVPVNELLLQIKRWLWKIYQQCPPLNPKKKITQETKKTYYDFIDFLKDSRLTDRLTLLTTNYDLIFEYLAWERGIPCVYPFKRENVEPLYVFKRTKRDYYVSLEPNERGPVICKLHGGINFFNLKEKNKESLGFGISYDIAERGEPFVPSRRPAIFMLNAIWQLQQKMQKLGIEIEPAIIPPTYAKMREHPWLQVTWKSSLDALKNANHIVFIGYSFPDSDGFIRAMISAAMCSRMAKREIRVFVVNPDKRALNRYRMLFPQVSSPGCYVPFGFCEAWKKGELTRIFSAATA